MKSKYKTKHSIIFDINYAVTILYNMVGILNKTQQKINISRVCNAIVTVF